jgi:hypothetical protein
MLETSSPINADTDEKIYSASTVPDIKIEMLLYFCTSIFWRAAVWRANSDYEGIKLGKYQEEIRRYLLGEVDFPSNGVVVVLASQLKRPALVFNFPISYRNGSVLAHTIQIPGLTFDLILNGQMPEALRLSCALRSPLHPIFVCPGGDRSIQRSIMKLMGKSALRGADYPLSEGVL